VADDVADVVDVREITPPSTRDAFNAMRELRSVFANEADFARYVDDVLRPEGYRLAGVFEHGRDDAVAVAGFRVGHGLSWGHYLYVDDLSTIPGARRRGHASRLLGWLVDEARRVGCSQLHLDSGVGLDRLAAHRLYFSRDLAITAYHFARRLAAR